MPLPRNLHAPVRPDNDPMSDKHRTDDLRIEHSRDLVPPAVFIEEIALSNELEDFVVRSRVAGEEIMKGKSDRLLVIAGPCSIHDPKSALEYAAKLKAARDYYAGELELVMRVYFE